MLFVLIGKCADVRHCRHRGTNTHALWQNMAEHMKQKRRAKDWHMNVILFGVALQHRLAVFGNSVHNFDQFCDMGILQPDRSSKDSCGAAIDS